jgi:hypothetical protein
LQDRQAIVFRVGEEAHVAIVVRLEEYVAGFAERARFSDGLRDGEGFI